MSTRKKQDYVFRTNVDTESQANDLISKLEDYMIYGDFVADGKKNTVIFTAKAMGHFTSALKSLNIKNNTFEFVEFNEVSTWPPEFQKLK